MSQNAMEIAGEVPKRREIIRHDPGVYVGLSDEAHHADDALGSTDIRHLCISGSDYWWRSKYNPLRDEEETKAQTNGHALHHRVLFGEEEFLRRYLRKPVKAEHPGVLSTADEIKGALKMLGLSTSGLKPELTQRLLRSSTRFNVWDAMLAEAEATGKVLLDADDYDRIRISTAMIEKNPSLARCFQNGLPEVSVFWETGGVRFKARFDYLRLNSIVDLKSFTNVMDRPIEQAISSDLGNKRLDLQATHYMNGRHRARDLIREGRVFGDVDRDWLAQLADIDSFCFVWVFYTVNGAPIARAWQYDPGTMTDQAAAIWIDRAVDIYKENSARFGLENLWVDQTEIHTFVDEDFPRWVR